MDDIRQPHNPDRRDYAIPVRRGPPTNPVHHPPVHHQPAPAHQPAYHPYQSSPQPQPAPVHQPPYQPQSRSLQPAHQTHAAYHPRKKRNLKPIMIIALPVVAAVIFAGGYSLKSKSDSNTIPASVTSQAKFNVYFPSPMPGGYVYMKNTATFQIGSVFYKFASGSKRVTVKEEPVTQTKPNLNLLAGYTQFDTANGRAAIGSSFGELTAVIITPDSVITLNSSGAVSQTDLKTAIANLKNIGQNPGPKTNG